MKLKVAPHTDRIAMDSGWTTIEKSTCYFKNYRKVIFNPETITLDEVQEFADFEKNQMYGQVRIVEVAGFSVILTHGVDSGD